MAQGISGQRASTKHLNEFALNQTERLSRTFSHIVWDDVAIREYKRILCGMGELYGLPATEKAVTLTIDGGGFLDPSRLRESIPRSDTRSETCPRCDPTEGWLEVMVSGEKSTRRIKCKHGPMTPTVQVWVGWHEVTHKSGDECHCKERKSVQAICCDYVDAQI